MAVFLLATLMAVTFVIASTAQADGPDEDELRKIKELIAQQRGDDHVKLPDNDKLTVPDDPKDGIAYRLEYETYDAETGETTTVLEGVARFYPPAKDTHDDKSVHDDGALAVYAGDSYSIAADASRYGFAAYVAIHDATAPTAYEFGYELPEGYKLSEDGRGGIKVINGEDIIVGAILAPWALDADGQQVPTTFKLRGDTLVQTVEHTEAAYPVVADPTFLGFHLTQ